MKWKCMTKRRLPCCFTNYGITDWTCFDDHRQTRKTKYTQWCCFFILQNPPVWLFRSFICKCSRVAQRCHCVQRSSFRILWPSGQEKDFRLFSIPQLAKSAAVPELFISVKKKGWDQEPLWFLLTPINVYFASHITYIKKTHNVTHANWACLKLST